MNTLDYIMSRLVIKTKIKKENVEIRGIFNKYQTMYNLKEK